jgi:hypothetical protein
MTMIKQIVLIVFLSISLITPDYAQDTSAYEIQRAKVNGLLAERSAKFGQYDQSLDTRTGIFGFQTKRDIRNSNEILRQVALTDNDIFKELKVLLDYKDLQFEQVQTNAANTTENLLNYRRTIKQLQDQNQTLTGQVEQFESKNTLVYLLMFTFALATAILAYLLRQKTQLLKSNEEKRI